MEEQHPLARELRVQPPTIRVMQGGSNQEQPAAYKYMTRGMMICWWPNLHTKAGFW
ncbi:MAG: hypothetical protein GY696_11490 [Gammaproteobacteria bacterium]|nr:hypothetical protein [Gammaproteobacteria bacterium]